MPKKRVETATIEPSSHDSDRPSDRSSLQLPYGGAPTFSPQGIDANTHRQQRLMSRRSLAVVQQALRGELSAEEAISSVAWLSGLPIRTDKGFLFVAPADGPDCAVATSADGFKPHGMRREGNLQVLELDLPSDRTVRYRLVQDGEWTGDPWARRFNYDEHGEYSLTQSPGAHLERWPNFYGDGVAGREVQVWVPPGNVTHRLFVHDGQNLFHPQAIHGGWRLQHTVGQHTMVVGIDNSQNRIGDLTATTDEAFGELCGGEGAAYYRYVQEVVRPHAEKHYGAATKTGVMGSSLGGLASLEIAACYPGAFDFVGSLSGSVGWGSGQGHETVQARLLRSLPTKALMYLDSGGGPGRDNFEENRDLVGALAAAGLAWNERLFHWYEAGAPHDEGAWADRVFRPVQIFEAL